MAPEQFHAKAVPASDQYSLGIVVYEWLCGTPPFTGNFLQLSYQHNFVPPPLLHEKLPSISSEVEKVVMKALAKDPGQRWPSVQTFALALERAYQPRPSLGATLLTYEGHDDVVLDVVWSPDGTRIASCSADKSVQVWAVT
jgi:eukaryotic-like serine/threonine-protein kinase